MPKSSFYKVNKERKIEEIPYEFPKIKGFIGIDGYIYYYLYHKYGLKYNILADDQIQEERFNKVIEKIVKANNLDDAILISLVSNMVFNIKDKEIVAASLKKSLETISNEDLIDGLGFIEERNLPAQIAVIENVRKAIEVLTELINTKLSDDTQFFYYQPQSFAICEFDLFDKVNIATYYKYLLGIYNGKISEKAMRSLCYEVKEKVDNDYSDIKIFNIGNKGEFYWESLTDYYKKKGQFNRLNDYIDINLGWIRYLLNKIYYDVNLSMPEKEAKMIDFLKELGIDEYQHILDKYYDFKIGEKEFIKNLFYLLKALHIIVKTINKLICFKDEFIIEAIKTEFKNNNINLDLDDLLTVYSLEEITKKEIEERLQEVFDKFYYNNRGTSLNSKKLYILKRLEEIYPDKADAKEFLHNYYNIGTRNKEYRLRIK